MMKRLQILLLNLYFYPLFLLCVGIGIPALTLYVACFRPFTSHRETMKRVRHSMVLWGRLVAAVLFPFVRVRYETGGTGEPQEPCIFICNHQSASDAFLMGVLSCEFVEIVNDWPFKIPVLGPYAKLGGFINIKATPPEEFMEQTVQLLQEGVSIIFFPEGTRSVGEVMGSFHSTAFRLAQNTGVPVIPLCIVGNEKIPPKGSSLLHPGLIRVRRLPPFTREQYEALPVFAFKKLVWDTMNAELQRMRSEA